AHAAESRINVLIVRLKPVSERSAEHAGGRTGRAALHHVVLAVKEIVRVARIERELPEAGEGYKNGRRPLPAVAEQIVYAKSALSVWGRVDRSRIPAFKIEVAKLWLWNVVPPGIQSFRAPRVAVCGPVPLRFSRQRLPCPERISARFRVADIYRPVQR